MGKISQELALLRSDKRGISETGQIVAGLPVIEIKGTRFPSIFERWCSESVLVTENWEYIDSAGKTVRGPVQIVTRDRKPEARQGFSFAQNCDEFQARIRGERLEPISALSIEAHQDIWIFITAHKTLREAHAYMHAAYHQSCIYEGDGTLFADDSDLCAFEGAFYTLLKRKTPAGRRGSLLIYGVDKLVLRPPRMLDGTSFIFSATEGFELLEAVMLPTGKLVTNEEKVFEILHGTIKEPPIFDPDSIWETNSPAGRVL